MQEIAKINNFPVYTLDKKIALKYSKEISALADEVPFSKKGHFNIMDEEKDGKILHKKFKHSLLVFDKEKPIAVLVAYEREPEIANKIYNENLLNITLLSVHNNYRKKGIARELMKIFFEYNKKFFYLKGKLKYSISTNSIDSNKFVQNFYKSLGFVKVGTKKCEDARINIVMKK